MIPCCIGKSQRGETLCTRSYGTPKLIQANVPEYIQQLLEVCGGDMYSGLFWYLQWYINFSLLFAGASPILPTTGLLRSSTCWWCNKSVKVKDSGMVSMAVGLLLSDVILPNFPVVVVVVVVAAACASFRSGFNYWYPIDVIVGNWLRKKKQKTSTCPQVQSAMIINY